MTARSTGAAVTMAMLGAGVVIAHQVAAKATRQALFLASFPVDYLPLMMIGASVFSLIVVLATSRAMALRSPAEAIPALFWESGLLHLAEWALVFRYPEAVALGFYLHFAGFGAVLISGFWSIVTERFDPHTARQRMGQIAAAGTLGSLAGGLVAFGIGESLSIRVMLPVLAAMHLACGFLVRALRPPAPAAAAPVGDVAGTVYEGAALLAKHPYLRHLALLVLLGAAGAALQEYVLNAQVKTHFAARDRLGFFALFYTAGSLIGFLLQTSLTRPLLEKAGLGTAVGTLPGTVALGSLGAVAAPGLAAAALARGSEQVVRNSVFRSAYELFYTSVPPAEKRSAKPLIDVGVERLGDMAGAALARFLLWAAASLAQPSMLAAAAGLGLAGVWVARKLDRGYVSALEKSLKNRAVELDLEDVRDNTTRMTLMRVIGELQPATPAVKERVEAPPAPRDPLLWRIGELRCGDPVRVRRALAREVVTPAIAPHVLPLLAWDDVAEDVVAALREAGPGITGQLVDALLDPDQDFAVRRRIPRVLSAFPSARAVDGLLLGLEDKRFEVRYRCGRALAAAIEKDPGLHVPPARVYEAVVRELDLGKHLWEGYRLLDGGEEDELVGERANRGLQHVFELLSLVLPRAPLRISLRALHTDDEMLHGMALEYLESVLPPPVREGLWPFLGDKRGRKGPQRSREEVLAALLQSHESIQMRLRELRARRSTET